MLAAESNHLQRQGRSSQGTRWLGISSPIDSKLFARCRAFSLTELLVVISLIATLIGFLLPGVSGARTEMSAISCENNVRQFAIALLAYAGDNNGRFPPNLYSVAPGQFWYDPARIGSYLPIAPVMLPASPSIWECPNDDGGIRSYAMNIWASSKVDSWMSALEPATAIGWSMNVRNASATILITEGWSYTGSAVNGWSAEAAVGSLGTTPGQRFGVGGGLAPPFVAGRWGSVNCELPFMRHRQQKSLGTGTEPIGRISIGYADGHVELKSDGELGDAVTGLSTLNSLWSPADTGTNH